MSGFRFDPVDPFYIFEDGGTSIASIEATDDDDGRTFTMFKVAILVHGKHILDGTEIDPDASVSIMLELEDAEALSKNLAATIRDYKRAVPTS